ncbi:glutathione transferase [Parvibium lacunae]|uniref:Glutathione transferase n=1 Tax=Parvibium lacunae TaxID=1888893 RepID=A0A368L0R0_9BURK|nr:glutathione transferase [Parvibium lacunae]RCS56987.1 glutathione transferase [Parvibium lacunae]
MKLYVDSDYSSPWAMTVFIALREKQRDFTLKTIDLEAGEQHQTPYATQSLTARVPMLVDGDFALTESTAIIEYLEERYPQPALYPSTVHERARARQIMAWIRTDLQVLRQERSTRVVFYQETVAQPLSANAQAAADKLITVCQQLLGANQPHVFANWSLVDVELAVMLQRLCCNGDPLPEALAHYAQQQWQHPHVQAWLRLIDAAVKN